MIDTMRFKLHVTPEQHDLLTKGFLTVPYRAKDGSLKQKKIGHIEIPPYLSKINLLSFSDQYSTLYMEGSIPKLWYGENVHLFYPIQLEATLEIIYRLLVDKLGSFPHYSLWEIQRLDMCYAWKFGTEQEAIDAIRLAQTLDYPRKDRHPYKDESVDFGRGSTKIKFYRKYPEFKKVGLPQLSSHLALTSGGQILELAKGVVRFEITFRRKALQYLLKKKSITYKDFVSDEIFITFMRDVLIKFDGKSNKNLIELDLYGKALSKIYKAGKVGRLMSHIVGYILASPEIKKILKRYSNSSDLTSNKKALTEAGVVFSPVIYESFFKFPIPSDLVVNLAPDIDTVNQRRNEMVDLIDPKDIEREITEDHLPF